MLGIFAASTTAFSISPLQPIPTPPCKPPVWTMSNFIWINSTHNLNCDRRTRVLETAALCMTGRSAQPPGYGPPDSLTVNITEIGTCRQRNPGSVPPREIGNGWIRCGSSAPTLFFQGDSNSNQSVGMVRVSQEFFCPNGVDEDGDEMVKMYTANGRAEFGLRCTHDTWRNATCVTYPATFVIPMTGWTEGVSRIVDDNLLELE